MVFLVAATAGAQSQLPPGTQFPDEGSTQKTAPGSARAATVAPALADAEGKIQQGDFSGARPLIEAYLKEHANDARALFDLGYLDQASHQDEMASRDYQAAVAADPKQFEARLAWGLMLAQEDKYADARQQLRQATLLTPASPNPAAQAQAYRALAELERQSDPTAARDDLLSAIRLSGETDEDLLLTAQIAEASGDSGTAEAAYRRILAERADSSEASTAGAGLAHLLIQQKEYSDAETLLTSALNRDPDDASLNAEMAAALLVQGKTEQALPVLEKLRGLEPKNSAVDRMLADAYSDAGAPGKADPLYSKLVAERPADADLLAAQGQNYIREQNYPQAQAVLQKALKLKPDDGQSWGGLALAASENHQYAAALQALSMRAKYLPETPSSYFIRATSYDNLHQTQAAAESYRNFIAADAGKFPDQERQARQRLAALGRTH